MSSVNPVIIVGAPADDEQLIRGQLDGIAEVLESVSDARGALKELKAAGQAIALVHLDGAREEMLSLVKELSGSGDCSPILVSRDRDTDTVLLAMRAGARDFAFLDEEEKDVKRAVLSLGQSISSLNARQGSVVALFGAKGGSGATTIATNLGGALCRSRPGARVVVVDLDLQMGDVPVFLDLAPPYGLLDVLRNMHRLDEDLLHGTLAAHPSGMRILAQGQSEEEIDDLSGQGASTLLAFLRRHYDFVIVDGLRDFSELSLAALDVAARIGLVITPDVPSLKNAYRCLGLFKRLGYGTDKVKLLLNRFHKKGVDLGAAADVLERRIDATIWNDFPTVIEAINQGQLLSTAAPRSRVTRDIESLLPHLCPGMGDKTDERPASLFRRLVR